MSCQQGACRANSSSLAEICVLLQFFPAFSAFITLQPCSFVLFMMQQLLVSSPANAYDFWDRLRTILPRASLPPDQLRNGAVLQWSSMCHSGWERIFCCTAVASLMYINKTLILMMTKFKLSLLRCSSTTSPFSLNSVSRFVAADLRFVGLRQYNPQLQHKVLLILKCLFILCI